MADLRIRLECELKVQQHRGPQEGDIPLPGACSALCASLLPKPQRAIDRRVDSSPTTATCSQKNTKAKITPLDRVFWVALFPFWPRWKQSLAIVKPDTVVRWHRKGFRLCWRWISKPGPGCPAISLEVRTLIKAFVLDNGWGARNIHAELRKLGFTVSLATVSRYVPKHPRDRGKQQRWMTFVRNHKDGIAAMDFFVVPTVAFRLLYVWFVIDHERRRILHVNVTSHPTSRWVVQQLRDSPEGRAAEPRPSPDAKVVGLPRVGGVPRLYTPNSI